MIHFWIFMSLKLTLYTQSFLLNPEHKMFQGAKRIVEDHVRWELRG